MLVALRHRHGWHTARTETTTCWSGCQPSSWRMPTTNAMSVLRHGLPGGPGRGTTWPSEALHCVQGKKALHVYICLPVCLSRCHCLSLSVSFAWLCRSILLALACLVVGRSFCLYMYVCMLCIFMCLISVSASGLSLPH